MARFVSTDVAHFLEVDGGAIEILGADGGVVEVNLVGACESCPSSALTLREGVERRLRAAFPEVQQLRLVSPATR